LTLLFKPGYVTLSDFDFEELLILSLNVEEAGWIADAEAVLAVLD
jgi:hypothetical protein